MGGEAIKQFILGSHFTENKDYAYPHQRQTRKIPIMQKTGPTIARGKSKQDYATPQSFIDACEIRFGKITLDLAASKENTKAEWFFSKGHDSFKEPWAHYQLDPKEYMWLNPPFGHIAPWAEKCMLEGRQGAQILFLTPASVGANWFRDFIYDHARVYALSGRLRFIGAPDDFPKDCILSEFGPAVIPGFEVWKWKDTLMQDPMFS